jgi:hypothetical protein
MLSGVPPVVAPLIGVAVLGLAGGVLAWQIF